MITGLVTAICVMAIDYAVVRFGRRKWKEGILYVSKETGEVFAEFDDPREMDDGTVMKLTVVQLESK